MSRKGATIARVLVVGVVALIIGGFGVLAVNHIHNWRMKSNEQSAIKTLRTLVTQENLWHKQDVDGNGVNDYWVIDVAGMYRVLRLPAGTEAKMIDIAIARSDWSPDGLGDGGGGEFPIVAVPFVPGKQVPGLAAMEHTEPVANSGYYVAAFYTDYTDKPFAEDIDGVGQAYEDTSRFAFMVFPVEYGDPGMDAFIVSSAGVIWRRDAVEGGYLSPEGLVPAPVGVAPLNKWPCDAVPRYGKGKCPECGRENVGG